VVLGVGYFGITKYNESHMQAEEVVLQKNEYVIDIDVNSVKRLEYSYNDQIYSFIKDGDTYKYEADKYLNINQNKIKTMRNYMAHLGVKQILEDVTDMAAYGLDDPQRYISFETAEKKYTILVGIRNEYTGDFYICQEGMDDVYIVASTAVTIYNKTIEDMIE